MAVSFQTGAEPIPGYTLLDRLGSGGFGEVWKCEAPGGIFKAVKVIHGDLRHKDTDAYRFAEQELKSIGRVKTVRHPYLLALDRFDIVDGRLVIVMELADCNLWDRFRECRAKGLPGIPRDELLGYMSEAAEVLDLMNDSHNLQHLDIKPQNLFLLYNHVKVADFGQVKDLTQHVAEVTGGITPVYAAPETFDGYVSRYCDQYSLACVYQELLTGVRPFDGTSMNQLLMQHLQHPPNLTPSPAGDRPALLKALAKKAEDRFPSVAAMVKAIRDGLPAASVAGPAADTPVPGKTTYAEPGSLPDSLPPLAPALASTPHPRGLTDTLPPADRPAPPEQTGLGPLRPAVLIGLGYAGQRVLRRFARLAQERCPAGERLSLVRTLYIDTDPDAVAEAVAGTGEPGYAPLPEEGVLAAPLNRAAYYLRPRNNGRALIEGWFDPSVLYRLPRSPVTTGLRCLGRLALCDHLRAVMLKVQAELDAAVLPEALAAAAAATGLEPRTNRPRVYLVTGLGGGTGSGMVFDLAYAVRQRLRRLGYANPDVVGLLLVPPADADVSAHARANTFAALTELNHYDHPGVAFTATDDAGGLIRDDAPPFARTVLARGYDHADPQPVTQTAFPARGPRAGGSSTVAVRNTTRTPAHSGRTAPDPAGVVAEYLYADLFTPIGRAADEARADLGPRPDATAAAVGLRRFDWPRAAVVDRTARVIAPVLVGQWVDPDPEQVRRLVPQWAGEQWQRLGLAPDQLAARLRKAADAQAGAPLTDLIGEATDPLVPKGWRARLPEPAAVAAAVTRLTALLGPPREAVGRTPSPFELAATAEAGAAIETSGESLAAMIPALLDTQAFRLAGTEEVVRQLLVAVDRARLEQDGQLPGREKAASAAYDRLIHYTYAHKGNRPTAADLTADLRDYPALWTAAVVGKRVVEVYDAVRAVLLARLTDLSACRQRVKEHHARMVAEAEVPAADAPPHQLLPPACKTVEEAAQRFLAALNDHDLNELEQRVQARVAQQAGGLYELCVNSATGPDDLADLVREVTRDYLHERMGEVDLAGMMKQKFGSTAGVGRALEAALAEAAPPAVGRGPWAHTEVCGFAAPDGAGGLPLIQQATAVLPPHARVLTTPDEVLVYREYPHVPLAALDQLGPAWAAAYQAAPDLLQSSPHARGDVTQWLSVDG